MRSKRSFTSHIFHAAADEVINQVASALAEAYGIPHRPFAADPLEVLIRTVLSQNTSDKNRDLAYEGLRRRFPNWEALRQARVSEIAVAIRQGGLARQKAARIKAIIDWVDEQFGVMTLTPLCQMGVEEGRALLLGLKGVGLKTANCVLAFGCGKEAFPVDTHILRIAKRLGLIPQKASAEEAHRILGGIVPEGMAIPLHLNLIRYGREVCKARRPLCQRCFFPELCTLKQGDRHE